MNSSMVEVVFMVHADLDFGEEIYISGNVPALGSDDINRALPLVTTPADFPWWRTKNGIFLPGGKDLVKYRYCVFSGGSFKRWEGDASFIRVLDVSNDKSTIKTTEDKFGNLNYEFSVNEKPQRKTAAAISKDDHAQRAKLFAAWNRSKTSDYTLGKSDAVIMVSYFLPVILSRTNTGRWSATWDKEALLSCLQLDVSRVVWVGSVRYGNAPIPVEEEDAVSSVLAELNCFPIFINQTMHYKFYDGFCKKTLWLVLHHVADVYGPLHYKEKSLKAQQDLWFNYSTVHKLFREKVLEVFQPGYLIWIHGLHLMLLPNFLRRRLPQAKIGYFFHTPFPSSEIWRTMSRREDLLRGLLGADQIGFHLYEYARHFLTTCHRLLGYSSEMNSSGTMTVNVDGRHVGITCIHVGVDLPRHIEIFKSDPFRDELLNWKHKFENKIVISGIDRLERLKGIPLRLMAIDRFLERNPQWIGKVVFALIGISAIERGHDYRQTQHDVLVLVSQINEKYGLTDMPVVYFEERQDRDIRLAQRLSFFAASDVLLMTATRDGLNRYPMEFTLARKCHGQYVSEGIIPTGPVIEGASGPDQGLVIISEFISSARVMRGAIVVNPWRVEEVTTALQQVLTMKGNERYDRSRKNLEYSARLTTTNWAKHVLSDLKAAEGNSDGSYAVGFGLQYKVMNLKAGFHALDTKEVSKAFRTSRHRLILLDWGGTLVPNVDKQDKFHAYAIATGHASQEGPSEELKHILETLCSDSKNTVFVVSGKEMRAVSKFFGGVKGLGLGAEHGFYYKWPREDASAWDTSSTNASSKLRWQSLTHVADDSWKESAKVVMDIFVQRTHGTYIEQKGNALIWQFSDADPEFGFLQSKELEDHLHSILANYPVEIIRGGGVADGYIEVRPNGASKGLFLEHAYNTLKASNTEPDFVLAIGDDSSDEPMFERISFLSHDQPQMNAFSVTVGKKPSAANAYVDDSSAVLELLTTLTKTMSRDRRYFSVADLPSHAFNDLSGFAQQVRIDHQDFHHRPPAHRPSLLTRATSDGRLALNNPEQNFKRSINLQSASNHSEDSTQSRTSVSLNFSMKDYMSSLSEDNQDDDGGIFF